MQLLQREIESKNCTLIVVHGDGNCGHRVLSWILYGSFEQWLVVRHAIVAGLIAARARFEETLGSLYGTWDNAMVAIETNANYITHEEWVVAAEYLGARFVIISLTQSSRWQVLLCGNVEFGVMRDGMLVFTAEMLAALPSDVTVVHFEAKHYNILERRSVIERRNVDMVVAVDTSHSFVDVVRGRRMRAAPQVPPGPVGVSHAWGTTSAKVPTLATAAVAPLSPLQWQPPTLRVAAGALGVAPTTVMEMAAVVGNAPAQLLHLLTPTLRTAVAEVGASLRSDAPSLTAHTMPMSTAAVAAEVPSIHLHSSTLTPTLHTAVAEEGASFESRAPSLVAHTLVSASCHRAGWLCLMRHCCPRPCRWTPRRSTSTWATRGATACACSCPLLRPHARTRRRVPLRHHYLARCQHVLRGHGTSHPYVL